jgi:pimeloyl-ACP methyl ester carboxylesterase
VDEEHHGRAGIVRDDHRGWSGVRVSQTRHTFIKAMGLEQVDLLGFSMGGMIAQEMVLMEPQLVRKMIIAGTGPAGGEGISTVARVTYLDMLRASSPVRTRSSSCSSPGQPAGSAPAKNFWRD